MQAKISKFIAAVLALVIIFANSWSVVSYAAEVFLSEKELENQNTTSKDGSVDFDVQYTNGKHSATLNIDEKNTKLNIAVSLKKSGYVKDLAIDFSSSMDINNHLKSICFSKYIISCLVKNVNVNFLD